MCGIIGVIGEPDASEALVDGLQRLEYRGYDSAGVATLANGHIQRCRAEGKIRNLVKKLAAEPVTGTVGIGHTRWATHGAPTENNAHPHATDKVAIVHNGIIDNYLELKAELESKQYRFESETDTEIVVHLVTDYLMQGMTPVEAAQASFKRLQGAYAILMIFAGEHDLMIGVRQGTPMTIGYGEGENAGRMYMASDAIALAAYTNRVCYLEDGDWAIIRQDGAEIFTMDGAPVERTVRKSTVTSAQTSKAGYRHFMLKEIHEQPEVIGNTLHAHLHPATGQAVFKDFDFDFASLKRLHITACGTAFFAGLVARYWFEELAGLPTEVDIASEYSHRSLPPSDDAATLVISQSGETFDTLEALRFAKSQGQKTLAVLNVQDSTIFREADHSVFTLAGPEQSVASSKAFTTQLATLACLAMVAARARGKLTEEREREIAAALREVPSRMAEILRLDDQIKEVAKDIQHATSVLYLGRGRSYPIATEGALKLKEVSYIHAEGYAAGEMKHGPIALIDETLPVVAIAPTD
ncbi:MAG: glutamine--fructose-6-phosphate transaminase (isomerizing), partial [Pseudomonadota bacterium]